MQRIKRIILYFTLVAAFAFILWISINADREINASSNLNFSAPFEHSINYEVEIKTIGNSILTGSEIDGFSIIVEMGELIDVMILADGLIMNSAYDIWFIIDGVSMGNYTTDDFGYMIACDYITKWLYVPNDAAGSFTIYFEDLLNNTIISSLHVSVTQ